VNRLDRFLQELDPDNMATMIYLVVEPETATIEFVNAGHPPPLLLEAEGKTSYLEGGAAMPLGVVPRARHKKSVARLEEGATLLLYTDGLVEQPGVPIDDGLERLSIAATASFVDLEGLCDRVLESMVPGEAKDDVALLAFKLMVFAGNTFDLKVRAEPNNLPRLRRAFRRWLERGGVSAEVAYEIATACSEACANVIDHAYEGSPGDLTVGGRLEDGELNLVIRDAGRWREPLPGDRGRGLDLIRALVDSLEVKTGPRGTEVTMRRSLDDQPST
jgi:anti-sigma regulatory factor (Ser/Thr protein kinase)